MNKSRNRRNWKGKQKLEPYPFSGHPSIQMVQGIIYGFDGASYLQKGTSISMLAKPSCSNLSSNNAGAPKPSNFQRNQRNMTSFCCKIKLLPWTPSNILAAISYRGSAIPGYCHSPWKLKQLPDSLCCHGQHQRNMEIHKMFFLGVVWLEKSSKPALCFLNRCRGI